jgi:hypothetical protein
MRWTLSNAISRSDRPSLQRVFLSLYVLILIVALVAFVRFVDRRVPSLFLQAEAIPNVKERLSVETELYKSVTETFAGAFVLAGLLFTWKTFNLSRQGQITDRFTKATDQLGSPSLPIRLGGIHALARIARDSSRDELPIMQILCDFVRETTIDRKIDTPLSTDVRSAVKFIASASLTGSRSYSLDLSTANLAGADLSSSVLNNINFEGSNLRGANLSGSMLQNCKFRGANLSETLIIRSDLRRSDLAVANLTDADLRRSRMQEVVLLGAVMDRTVILNTDLRSVRFATEQQLSAAIWDETTQMPVLVTTLSDGVEPFF